MYIPLISNKEFIIKFLLIFGYFWLIIFLLSLLSFLYPATSILYGEVRYITYIFILCIISFIGYFVIISRKSKIIPLSAREITYVSLSIALSFLLGTIQLLHMPFGGTVSLEMLPLFYLAFNKGTYLAMIAGGIYGLFVLLLDSKVVHPLQFILDYPLAFSLVGLAGLIKSSKKSIISLGGGVLLGSGARALAHIISGVFFFSTTFLWSNLPWWLSTLLKQVYSFCNYKFELSSTGEKWLFYILFSTGYNLFYILPSSILCFIFLLWIIKRT